MRVRGGLSEGYVSIRLVISGTLVGRSGLGLFAYLSYPIVHINVG